jgi:hypothetical protein
MKDRTEAMTLNELTCQEFVELVTDYLEGALPDGERMRFDDHMAGCTGCTRYLEQMRWTITTAGRLRENDLSPAVRDEMIAVFRTWKSGQNNA